MASHEPPIVPGRLFPFEIDDPPPVVVTAPGQPPEHFVYQHRGYFDDPESYPSELMVVAVDRETGDLTDESTFAVNAWHGQPDALGSAGLGEPQYNSTQARCAHAWLNTALPDDRLVWVEAHAEAGTLRLRGVTLVAPSSYATTAVESVAVPGSVVSVHSNGYTKIVVMMEHTDRVRLVEFSWSGASGDPIIHTTTRAAGTDRDVHVGRPAYNEMATDTYMRTTLDPGVPRMLLVQAAFGIAVGSETDFASLYRGQAAYDLIEEFGGDELRRISLGKRALSYQLLDEAVLYALDDLDAPHSIVSLSAIDTTPAQTPGWEPFGDVSFAARFGDSVYALIEVSYDDLGGTLPNDFLIEEFTNIGFVLIKDGAFVTYVPFAQQFDA